MHDTRLNSPEQSSQITCSIAAGAIAPNPLLYSSIQIKINSLWELRQCGLSQKSKTNYCVLP